MPTAFRPEAQGWRPAPTLGHSQGFANPNGVAPKNGQPINGGFPIGRNTPGNPVLKRSSPRCGEGTRWNGMNGLSGTQPRWG